jgi:formylmethanofuran dehydrogenase subunit C
VRLNRAGDAKNLRQDGDMATVRLRLRKEPDLPVEAESLIPENVAGLDPQGIGMLPLLVGKHWEKVSDYFDVDAASGDGGEGGDAPELVLDGNLERFKRLGEKMSRGRLTVNGPVGFHAGAWMRGGELVVNGDAGDYLGAHMAGGLIRVNGDIGHYAASAYRGYASGMKGGTIVATGRAGQMLGSRMRRGLVYVMGGCGDVPGFNMKAGTVIVGGEPGERVGARMVRGTVVVLGPATELLPTFHYDCTYRPVFWGVLRNALARLGAAPGAGIDAAFRRFSGDANEGGRGEVLIRAGG